MPWPSRSPKVRLRESGEEHVATRSPSPARPIRVSGFAPWAVARREAPWEGFGLGEWVEVMSRGAVNRWRTGTMWEMRWSVRWNKIHYYIEEAGQPIPKAYSREDLRHVEPTLGSPDKPAQG